jgi:LysM repeat protein
MVKNKRNLLLSLTVILGILLAPNDYMLSAHAKTNNSSIHYTIKKGDTFYLLGLRFNSSVKDISSMNPKKNPRNLIIGSKIKLPVGPEIEVHHVKKGDTLGNIASKYNSSVNMIATQNNVLNSNLIYPGDILAIPKINKELIQIAGKWVSTGTTKYHSTTVVISPTGSNTFTIYFDAWQVNAFGSVQMRDMSGKGKINNNSIEFAIDKRMPEDNLTGVLRLQEEKMIVDFIGDLWRYQGSYVGFEKEFIREKP